MAARNYVRHGRLEPDKGIRRGPMLVYSEAEWRERHDAIASPIKRKVALFLGTIYLFFVMVILFLWLIGVIEGEDWVDAGLFLVFLTVVFGLPFLGMWHSEVYGSTPGLYQLGVQQDFITFVPYWEVMDTRRVTVEDDQREVIALTPKYERRGLFLASLEPWTIDVDLLGEEGVRMLEARVRAAGSPEQFRDEVAEALIDH